MTRRSDKAPFPVLYEVRWQKADLQHATPSGNYGGTMEGVSGTIYENNKPVAKFVGQRAFADSETNLLRVQGQVKVDGLDPAGVLTCDTMEWRSDEQVVRAIGTVRLTTQNGVLGPMRELWSTPKLDTVATPDLFPRTKRGGE